MSIKGYKVFNPDWTCRGFQYEVGKTYKHEGNIEMCGAGFHFCQKIIDCFNYYSFDSNNKVAEVEAIGLVKTSDNKSVTDKIVIVRELTWHEVLDLANTGRDCTGNRNSGNYNSGDCNSGNRNSGSHNSGNRNNGDWNSGDVNSGDFNSGNRNSGNCNNGSWNSGNWNSGDGNSGNWNSGDDNSGDWNSGNYNSGNRNSGNWNSGNDNSGNWNSTNFSTGFFNTIEQPLYAFNKPLNISRDDFNNNIAIKAMNRKFENNWWICSENMTDKEKETYPEHETTGGYLKTVDFKTACSMMWDSLTYDEKQSVKQIPNFDAEVFKEITGIDVN